MNTFLSLPPGNPPEAVVRPADSDSDVRTFGHVQIIGLFWSASETSNYMDDMLKANSARRTRSSSPFTRNLIRLMEERGMSVREAARVAGVGRSTISSWRAGASPANFIAVLKLARALGVSFSFLLTGQDETRSGGKAPSVTEVLDEGRVLFDGVARIRVQELIERRPGERK